jgi:hypothetical protein
VGSAPTKTNAWRCASTIASPINTRWQDFFLLLLLLLYTLFLFQASDFLLMDPFRHLVGLLGRGISPAPRPLPTNRTTQHRETQTHIHAPSSIRTCDPNVRAAEESIWSSSGGVTDSSRQNLRPPLIRVVFGKLIITQLVKRFSVFAGTRRFMTMFTRALYWALSKASWIQSTLSYLIFVIFICLLSI